ncbi:Transcription factor MYB88 [Linum perenne]
MEDDKKRKKERHIVTWTPEEDDILRQQISLHGTENWAIIASKFNDKTTRQCRRRWYTYLNSDFKKGGWSPEEDLLLCEAQRVFGNRWTEIAKVVSGRTDNAVKNRFTTLCKKRAKYEALAKGNDTVFTNSNNKRVMSDGKMNSTGNPENAIAAKRMRRNHFSDQIENHNFGDRSHPKPRSPFMALASDVCKVNADSLRRVDCAKDISSDAAQSGKTQRTFLKKDDPKISALMQQAELLSTLALKVNAENTDQSLEHAWKVLQDYLKKGNEDEIPSYAISDLDFQLEDFKDLIEDLRSSSDGSHISWRHPALYEGSPASSEFSTGSSLMPYLAPNGSQDETNTRHNDVGSDLQSVHIAGQNGTVECDKEIISGENIAEGDLFQSFDEQTNEDTVVSCSSSTEFGSPRLVTPIFRSLAAGVPSPHFSESERRFLLKTLGVESPFPNPSIDTSQPPPCKRVLLQSL